MSRHTALAPVAVSAAAAAALALAGCASVEDVTTSLRQNSLFSSSSTATVSAPAAQTRSLSPQSVGPDDLVTADGSCAQVLSPAEPESGPPAAAGGVALDMTECEVVRRNGRPARVDIGSNERGRTAVLTYLRNERPGIYRFSAGRLTVIERAPEAAVPNKPKRVARPSGPSNPGGLRPTTR
jgi:hypothetical protein